MIEYLFSNSIILTFLEKNINNNKSQHDISHVNEGSFFNVYFFVLRAKTFQHVFQMAIILPPSLPRYRNQQLIFVTFVFAMIDQSYDIIMINYLFSNSYKWLSFFHLHNLRINNTINLKFKTNLNFQTVYIGTKIKITSRFQTKTKRVLRTGIQQHCLDNLHFMTYIFHVSTRRIMKKMTHRNCRNP